VRSAAFTLLLALAAPAFAVDEADLARRQADQRQARAMAREMVSTVLDLQLRQLDENGLTDLPLYRDIKTMRGNLARLVETEMAAVVERLVEAQHASGADREAKFVEARRAIRTVVVRLSVERQALLRRLKAAEIVEQATRLIELQTAAREGAAALPGLPEDRRPDAALKTLEDQRDVKEVFLRLVETLGDVKTWDGPIATAASDGLRLLKEADAGKHLDEAEQTLASAAFGETTTHQDAALDALRKLLTLIEKAQGQLDSQGGGLAETVRRLKEQQQALRAQVESEGLTEPKPERVEAQQKIAAALAELADDLAGNTTAEPLRKQAEAAAKAATEALFAADEPKTLAEQQRTIDRLTALEEAVATGTEDQHDRSAAELAKAVQDLEKAKQELKQAADKHAEAAREGAAKPQAAGEAEKAAAEQAGKIDEGKELPASVAARIEDATDEARSAAEALAAAARDDAAKDKAAAEAVAKTGDAFQRAQAAVEEALADAKRSEAAVRIGELARAAEALERAAAAERQLGETAAEAAKANGLTAEQAGKMKHVQADVQGVVSKTAEGVKAAAPKAAEALGRALDAAKQADAALSQAAAAPGESSKPAAGHAGEQAAHTAEAITQAAAELRNEIGKAAGELAGLAQEQLAPVATAEQAVSQATEAVSGDPQQAAQAAGRAADASAAAETTATAAAQAARHALAGEGTTEDAADALDRAAIGLAARQQQLEQDHRLAERLGQLAARQQAAVQQIEQARQSLVGAPSDPQAMSKPQRQAAQTLHAATRQFAAVQRATGQGAARVSGQQQVANVPIREALETAERLPVPHLPTPPVPAPEGEQVAQGDRGEKVEGAQQPAANSGAENQNQAGAAQNSSQNGTPSDTGSAQPGGTEATGLGTGLVPAAPQETARMMAGADAQAALAALEAMQATESMEDVAASDTDLALNDAVPPGENADDAQQAAKGAPTQDGPPADSDSQNPDAAGRDSDAGPGSGRDAAWFAKLPPEVRAAIRGSASQPAPKGYEGKLRRYFESVDK
jgi:hypothetical protein